MKNTGTAKRARLSSHTREARILLSSPSGRSGKTVYRKWDTVTDSTESPKNSSRSLLSQLCPRFSLA